MKLLALLLWGGFLSLAWAADATVDFNRDVQPILSDKCFHCHGPDAKNKNIALRLDKEGAAKAELAPGKQAVIPGDAVASEVIKRLEHPKPALRMPPPYSGLKISDEEIATIRRWIEQGARWERHWAFLPPKRPDLPRVSQKAWLRNPIDAFVLARLEKEGLKPSPEAEKRTLLRRVTLDLTGLPPTPEELSAFEMDAAPDAYERAVDRLLASPRYGERMAMPWLDAARYADTNGYQFDGPREMWRWRDWVIESLNRNKPFDQFVKEQIAGDLLPNATLDQIIATGFNRNHRINTEDGIILEEYAVEQVVDRVETASTVFLGVTLGCARCHNHKYDPFTQKDFYQVYAYFNNVPELGRGMKYGNTPPVVPAPTLEQQAKHGELVAKINSILQAIDHREKALAKEQKVWERELLAQAPTRWTPALMLHRSFPLDGPGGGLETKEGEPAYEPGIAGKALVLDGTTHTEAEPEAWPFDIRDPFTVSLWVKPEQQANGTLLSKMKEGPENKGFGLHLRDGKILFHLTTVWVSDAIRMETDAVVKPNEWTHILATYDGSSQAQGVQLYVNGTPVTTRVDQDTLYRPFVNAGKIFREPLRIGAGWDPKAPFRGAVDEVLIYPRLLEPEELGVLALREDLQAIAAKPVATRSATERNALRWQFLSARHTRLWAELQALKRERIELERSFPTAMVMAELDRRRDTHLLVRGAYDAPGKIVEPGVPEVLPSLPEGVPNNRLGFAEWVVDRGNPLTARVAVNRFWQMYFGTGLVKTAEDFGLQGEWPSHPDLLDWLAVEFMDSGWDIKRMQRLIVTSATYRQSSASSPEWNEKDPENRLLARGPRLRLPAAVVRDQALFIAGLLHEKIGGPSVKPYQPEGLWKEVVMQDMDYVQSQGPDLYRRSLYTYWKRTVAPPMMMNFDAAGRESCVVRPVRTNTPLQALNLMNDTTFVEAARFLGQRMILEGGEHSNGRLEKGLLLAAGRAPTQKELAVLERNLKFHLDYYSQDPKRAEEWIAIGDSRPDSSVQPVQLAAYGAVASLILNLDETITKE